VQQTGHDAADDAMAAAATGVGRLGYRPEDDEGKEPFGEAFHRENLL
jgi:hypothetical protein